MQIRSFIVLGFLCFSLFARLDAAPFSTRLLKEEALWGDGNAEFSIYDAQELRYGVLRKTRVIHILVREAFSPKAMVKADDWQEPGAYNVIKLNQIITVPTGVYRYDQTHSAFWRVSDGALVKFSLTSSDSCGNTFKLGEGGVKQWLYRAFTYWEGMHEVDRRVTTDSDLLWYDELPFKLRTLDWEQVKTFSAPLFPSVVNSKEDLLKAEKVDFQVEQGSGFKRVKFKHPWGGMEELEFEEAFPYRLKSWQRGNGSRLELLKSVRIPYWKLNKPGDEALLNLPNP